MDKLLYTIALAIAAVVVIVVVLAALVAAAISAPFITLIVIGVLCVAAYENHNMK